MKEIKAYQCDFCKRISKTKGFMTEHEKECYLNPISRACETCGNLHQMSYVIDDVLQITRNMPYCTKGIEITTPVNTSPSRDFRINLKYNCPSWEQKIQDETGKD